jgi:hypothetical protein
MKATITIRTPPGQAKKTEGKIGPFILGSTKHTTETCPEDDKIIWHVDEDSRKLLKIHRNINAYGLIIKGIFNNKLLGKIIQAKVSKEEQAQLKEMLENQTSITFDLTPNPPSSA